MRGSWRSCLFSDFLLHREYSKYKQRIGQFHLLVRKTTRLRLDYYPRNICKSVTFFQIQVKQVNQALISFWAKNFRFSFLQVCPSNGHFATIVRSVRPFEQSTYIYSYYRSRQAVVIWIQKVTSQKVFNSESAFLYCRRITIIFLQYKNEGQAGSLRWQTYVCY